MKKKKRRNFPTACKCDAGVLSKAKIALVYIFATLDFAQRSVHANKVSNDTETNMNILANNEQVSMTRRFPNLPQKILRRDSEIVKKIMLAWDVEHDRNKVFDIYLKEHKNLSDERYWELMRTVWVICGGLDNVETFKKLMKSSRKQKHYFSTPEESKKLRELPEKFIVYRAANEENDSGISYTLSEEYAFYYQKLYYKKHIFSKMIDKKEVFALIDRNLESEIVLFS